MSQRAYSSDMQHLSIKAAVAMVWVSAVCVAGIAVDATSLSGWAVLAGIVVLPPIVMMWQWKDAPRSRSERIQEARR